MWCNHHPPVAQHLLHAMIIQFRRSEALPAIDGDVHTRHAVSTAPQGNASNLEALGHNLRQLRAAQGLMQLRHNHLGGVWPKRLCKKCGNIGWKWCFFRCVYGIIPFFRDIGRRQEGWLLAEHVWQVWYEAIEAAVAVCCWQWYTTGPLCSPSFLLRFTVRFKQVSLKLLEKPIKLLVKNI